MRLHFDFSEYEEDDEPSRVLVTVTIPDGSGHSRITDVYNNVLSLFMGYPVDVSGQAEFNFSFEEEEPVRGCPDCVQGTCVFSCGKEFK